MVVFWNMVMNPIMGSESVVKITESKQHLSKGDV